MIHASLFSGIGGPEVAAAMMGWTNAFHCEINPFGRAVLEYWFPESKSYEDITKTNFREWRGKIDVLTGGFPCQPFSYAGKRGGREDERYLWPQMLRAIDEIRPTWVIGENVAGITTMVEGGVLADMGCSSSLFQEGDDVHGYELEQSFTIERICCDLERLGYSVQPVLIPAAAVGAPHRRDRVFIVAYVADSDRSDDAGRTGIVPSSLGTERIQERDAVREFGVAGFLRSEVQVSPSDSDIRRSGEISPEVHAGVADGNEFVRDGGERYVADTVVEGLEREDESGDSENGKRMRLRGDSSGYDWEGMRPEERWADFPTVSPIHRGNDGIPFRLDDLSIPQTRWRTESLKAYGNAIVPQVMYRIFQAIEQVGDNQ